MKLFWLMAFLLPTIPAVLVLTVNTFARSRMSNEHVRSAGLYINSAKPDKTRCTWHCHNNTAFCQKHHVKYLKAYLPLTDQPYFGVIDLLKGTGQYRLANIVWLVVVIPFAIYLLLLANCYLLIRIRQRKKLML